MPKLYIELSGTEFDRLVAYARSLRRTPNQQAAQLVADAMEELAADQAPMLREFRSPEAQGAGDKDATPAETRDDRGAS